MLLSNSNAIETGGYAISNSLRFQSASTQYLNRTFASVGNRSTWTWSAWVKRGNFSNNRLFSTCLNLNSGSETLYADLYFETNGTLNFYQKNSTTISINIQTSAVYRDPSAWYHVILAYDDTQATASNRVKIYINGSQVTAFNTATYPSQNFIGFINGSQPHAIGTYAPSTTVGAMDGYITEVNFVDGQALTPAAFGETDVLTGQWVAKKYTGTYGTNGFYLPFSNGTSTTTLGYDSSGNSNNWTLNNFTRSAGRTDCWMIDVPSGNGGVEGTQPSSNYCVLNPLKVVGGNTAASAGNLNASSSANSWGTRFTTVGMLTGKWYWEVQRTGNTYGAAAGMATEQLTAGDLTGTGAVGWAENGTFCNEAGSYTGSSKTWVTNDILQFRYDADAGQLDINVNNGTWVTLVTGKSGRTWFPIAKCYGGSDALSVNFGQRSFAYTPPTGFKALCTANLPAATIKKGNQYMDATTYTGNGAARSITNAGGFQPDIVWVKSRSNAYNNVINDAVRGSTKLLITNGTDAEQTEAQSITSFDATGFSLGTAGTWNQNGSTFVAWQWDAGSSTVTNTSGTISSQVRANPTAGVSVVTYSGQNTAGTVGHGLGVAPKMIIVKQRNSTGGWITYHASLPTPATNIMYLNTTAAVTTGVGTWNSTNPTSTVFSLTGNDGQVNQSGSTYVAYCFSEIAGFSKFGSYAGNGSSDGNFLYFGFRPKWIMIKKTSAAGDSWYIKDTSRSPYNVGLETLLADTSGAEAAGESWDALSNGIKLRTTGSGVNTSGATYIYMAFAESPFQNSNSR